MWSSEYRLLTAKDASTYLGISLSTLNRIEKEGLLIPFRTPGGHRRYNRKILDEYLEKTRQQRNGNHRSADGDGGQVARLGD